MRARISIATSANMKPPASLSPKPRNAKESGNGNAPGTAPSRHRAHDKRLTLPATKAEPLLQRGCTSSPENRLEIPHRRRRAAAAIFTVSILPIHAEAVASAETQEETVLLAPH